MTTPTEESLVYLPFSRFFNAPDQHQRGYRAADARKFDVYSFGLLVYWVLVGRKVTHEDRSFLRSINYQFYPENVARYALKGDLSKRHENLIVEFFEKTLADDHKDRSDNWDVLLPLLYENVFTGEASSFKIVPDPEGPCDMTCPQSSVADLHPPFKVRHFRPDIASTS